MANLLVAEVELLETLAILETFEATDPVVLQVELAQLCALFEAVHLGDLVAVEVDLHQVLQPMQSSAQVCQEVVLEVEDL